jgi:hypothetical protein
LARRLETRLIELYLRARADGASAAVTWATARIEQLLQTDPDLRGESRSGRSRILIELPVLIEFEVHYDLNTVIVTQVRYHPPKK